jgi:hypothetical protein
MGINYAGIETLKPQNSLEELKQRLERQVLKQKLDANVLTLENEKNIEVLKNLSSVDLELTEQRSTELLAKISRIDQKIEEFENLVNQNSSSKTLVSALNYLKSARKNILNEASLSTSKLATLKSSTFDENGVLVNLQNNSLEKLAKFGANPDSQCLKIEDNLLVAHGNIDKAKNHTLIALNRMQIDTLWLIENWKYAEQEGLVPTFKTDEIVLASCFAGHLNFEEIRIETISGVKNLKILGGKKSKKEIEVSYNNNNEQSNLVAFNNS